jgi:hypothetical protein
VTQQQQQKQQQKQKHKMDQASDIEKSPSPSSLDPTSLDPITLVTAAALPYTFASCPLMMTEYSCYRFDMERAANLTSAHREW